MALSVGTTAPDFTLTDQNGNDVSLEKFRGQPVLVVFIPAAFTGVCQGELCELRDTPAPFDAQGVQVLAITCDPKPVLKEWATAQGYGFPLLSDFWPHGAIAEAYGVFNADLGIATRGSFLIDSQGTIAAVIESTNLGVARPMDDYQAALAQLS
ncbi:MAG: peroxiredoxin [Acidimicrobiia bacterium]